MGTAQVFPRIMSEGVKILSVEDAVEELKKIGRDNVGEDDEIKRAIWSRIIEHISHGDIVTIDLQGHIQLTPLNGLPT